MPAPDSGSSGGDPAGRPANVADFTFEAGTLTRDQLRVVRFTGREGLSRLFEYHIEFYASAEEEIDPSALVGTPCNFEIATKSSARVVHGLVRRFEYVGETAGGRYYAADVTAKHWILTRRSGSRIYQSHNCSDMTAKGIIQKALENAGFQLTRDFKFVTEGSFAEREYCVQYRESDWDFINRLMEEEGMYFFFQHTNEGHVLMIGDSPVGYQQLEGDDAGTFPFKETTGMENHDEDEFVYSVRDAHEIQIGKVAFDAYNFEQANTPLWAEQAADRFTDLCVVDFEDGYRESSVGTNRAKARLDAYQCNRNTQQMTATVRQFVPGYKFTLSEHPTESLNREYLVVELIQRGDQSASAGADALVTDSQTFQSQLRTIPAGVPWRPPRVTPKPRIYGSQTAIVTAGGADEGGAKDEYARLKISFFWDCEGSQDDNSSCWVRYANPAAGGKYGTGFRPHKGQEVVVTFLEGDPDRPLITGAVYNSNTKPHYSPEEHATKTYIKTGHDGATNEIVFEDKSGEEELLMHAGRDFHLNVVNARFDKVGEKYHLHVVDDRLTKLDKNDHHKVAMSLNCSVGGTYSLGAGQDIKAKADSNVGLEAGQKIEIKAGTEIVLDAGASISIKAGGSFVTIGPSGVDISGPMVKINSGGSASAASAVNPAGAENAEDAKESDPGSDTDYSRPQRPGGPSTPGDKPYTPPVIPPPPPPPEPVPEFYEIQFLEDDGEPVANEPFRAEMPQDTVFEGVTDAEGVASFEGPPGHAKISFPQRENAEWTFHMLLGPGENAAGPVQPGSGNDIPTAPPAPTTS